MLCGIESTAEEKYVVCHVDSASEVFVLELCTCTMLLRIPNFGLVARVF